MSKPVDEGEPAPRGLASEPLCTCPFCGGDVAVAFDPLAVLHTLPVCTKYAALAADAFLVAVHDALVGAKPS